MIASTLDESADSAPSPSEENAPSAVPKRECPRCGRASRACICAGLPSTPVEPSGHIAIFQHPFEAKRKDSTTRILGLTIAPGLYSLHTCRKPSRDRLPDLFRLLDAARAAVPPVPVFLLFPAQNARDLAEVLAEPGFDRAGFLEAELEAQTGVGSGRHPTNDSGAAPDPSSPPGPETSPSCAVKLRYILIAIDATWKEAKEMCRFAVNDLSPLGITPVLLSGNDVAAVDSAAFLLRRQPAKGAVSTLGAVAAAVGLLEGRFGAGGGGGGGDAVRDAILAPLLYTASLQSQWDPDLRARMEGTAVGGNQRLLTRVVATGAVAAAGDQLQSAAGR